MLVAESTQKRRSFSHSSVFVLMRMAPRVFVRSLLIESTESTSFAESRPNESMHSQGIGLLLKNGSMGYEGFQRRAWQGDL